MPLLEVLKIDDVSFVRGAELEIVASLIGTLVEDCLEAFSHAYVIAPVGAGLQKWLFLAHNLARVVYYCKKVNTRKIKSLTLDVVIEIVLVKLDRDPGALLQAEVDLAIFVDSNVGPGALSILAWSVDDNSLSVE